MVALVPFDVNAVPAHLKPVIDGGLMEANNDLAGGVSSGYPVISYKGKVWSITQGGERTTLLTPQNDPVPGIEVVILKSNPALSKVYYPDGYEEGSTDKPVCHSNNGVVPSPDAETPQAVQCAICPHNQWGSRITDNGKKGKACSDSRRMAVAPSDALDQPHLLRVPAASLKELVAYANDLNRRGAPYTAVRTRITFDHTVAHPQFKFAPTGWLDAEEFKTVQEVIAGETVAAIVGVDEAQVAGGALGAPPAHVVAAAAATAPAPTPAAPTPKPAAPKAASTPKAAPAPKAAAPAPTAAPKAAGFGQAPTAMPVGPQTTTVAEVEVVEVAEAEVQPEATAAEPEEVEAEVVEAGGVSANTSKLMVDADADLDDVLSMLDD